MNEAQQTERKLTARQERFAAEYVIDLNATKAAIRAGYSPKGAEVTGCQLLRNPKVAERIAASKAKRLKRTEITQDRVLEELALLAFSDVTHYVVNDAGGVEVKEEAPDGAQRAISSVKRKVTTDDEGRTTVDVEVKLWDKPMPLKLAGRHVGLFPDRAAESLEKIQQMARDFLDQKIAEARERRNKAAAEAPKIQRPGGDHG